MKYDNLKYIQNINIKNILYLITIFIFYFFCNI